MITQKYPLCYYILNQNEGKTMQIIKLMGGLGNQMFQYALAKAIGEEVLFDISWFEKENKLKDLDHLNIELQNFNTSLKIATEEQIKYCLNENSITYGINKIFRRFQTKILPSNRIYEKIINKYQADLIDNSNDRYYEGFFQSTFYFNGVRDILLKDFTLSKNLESENEKMLYEIQNTNSISISVRHGIDYINLGWDLKADYYNKAMDYMEEAVEDPTFYLFSDDIEWCKKVLNMQKHNVIIANSKDENCSYACGIYLMSKCMHNIISNSTYPWWGAWLNNNHNKIVIMPQKWISIKSHLKTIYDELYCDNWIRL